MPHECLAPRNLTIIIWDNGIYQIAANSGPRLRA
jgi:hypothetical protein